MQRPGGRSLELDDGALNHHPDVATLVILALCHLVDPLGGNDFRVRTMPLKQQVRRSVDVEIGDHRAMLSESGKQGEPCVRAHTLLLCRVHVPDRNVTQVPNFSIGRV